MKLPIIRQLYQNHEPEHLEKNLEFLEGFCEFRGVNEHEVNTIGEMITNICGALEVHSEVRSGKPEKDALNGFAQKVMGSIDKN